MVFDTLRQITVLEGSGWEIYVICKLLPVTCEELLEGYQYPLTTFNTLSEGCNNFWNICKNVARLNYKESTFLQYLLRK